MSDFTEWLASILTPRTDIRSADLVHITIDQNHEGVQVWIDVDGPNRFRLMRVSNLVITDRRQTKPED